MAGQPNRVRTCKVLSIVAIALSAALAVFALILLRTEIAPPALGFTIIGLVVVLFVVGTTALGVLTFFEATSHSSSDVRRISKGETGCSNQEEGRVWAAMSHGELQLRAPEFQKVALKRAGSRHIDFKTSSSIVPVPEPGTPSSDKAAKELRGLIGSPVVPCTFFVLGFWVPL